MEVKKEKKVRGWCFYCLNVLLKAKTETIFLSFNILNFAFSKVELSGHQFFFFFFGLKQ